MPLYECGQDTGRKETEGTDLSRICFRVWPGRAGHLNLKEGLIYTVSAVRLA